MNLKVSIVIFYLLFVWFPFDEAIGQNIQSEYVDGIVNRTMQTFDVPGVALAIIKNGNIIHSKGYGVVKIGSKDKIDEKTLFAIASNTKAFTAAALGILIDERKLNWDDRVIDYIPEFRMYNPYVTEEFTIRDLLTHRSGLGLGAGDLMIYPNGNDYTINELIYNMRYLKPNSGFRSKYDYDNLLYIIAGEVVARVSGISWEQFIEKRIMAPLEMSSSASNFQRLKDTGNIAAPHAVLNGKLGVVERYDLELLGGAGSIYSNIEDMCKWAKMQLFWGKYDNDNKQLISIGIHQEMWNPQTIMQGNIGGYYNTHFKAYGLGWVLSDVKGSLEVSHTGGLPGMVTMLTLLPELQLGIIVLTNQQSGEALQSITDHIIDFYLGIQGVDHIKENYDGYISSRKFASELTQKVWDEVLEKTNAPSSAMESIAGFMGEYKDDWFGDISIFEKEGKMRLESKRSPKLCGDMYWYKGNTFVVKWDDRSLEADAFVLFELDLQGKPSGFHMKAVSPLSDFSYDFHDLDFSRIYQ